jgi:hypothetical protein
MLLRKTNTTRQHCADNASYREQQWRTRARFGIGTFAVGQDSGRPWAAVGAMCKRGVLEICK